MWRDQQRNMIMLVSLPNLKGDLHKRMECLDPLPPKILRRFKMQPIPSAFQRLSSRSMLCMRPSASVCAWILPSTGRQLHATNEPPRPPLVSPGPNPARALKFRSCAQPPPQPQLRDLPLLLRCLLEFCLRVIADPTLRIASISAADFPVAHTRNTLPNRASYSAFPLANSASIVASCV